MSRSPAVCGTAVILLAFALSLAGCGSEPPEASPRADAAAPGADRGPLGVLAFSCSGDRHFLALIPPGRGPVTLLDGDEVHTLMHGPTVSGRRFLDDRMTLEIEGEKIRMSIDGEMVDECRNSGRQRVLEQHWLQGVYFLALGDEPSWTLTAAEDSLTLTTDMGQRRHRFGGSLVDAGRGLAVQGVWEFAGHDGTLKISLRPGPCLHTMSGEPFPTSARLEWAGRVYLGCGLRMD